MLSSVFYNRQVVQHRYERRLFLLPWGRGARVKRDELLANREEENYSNPILCNHENSSSLLSISFPPLSSQSCAPIHSFIHPSIYVPLRSRNPQQQCFCISLIRHHRTVRGRRLGFTRLKLIGAFVLGQTHTHTDTLSIP